MSKEKGNNNLAGNVKQKILGSLGRVQLPLAVFCAALALAFAFGAGSGTPGEDSKDEY